jgi:hypothetical protein
MHIPRGQYGQESGSELLATIATVITCGYKCVARANVFGLARLLQANGRGNVNSGDFLRGFVVQAKCNKFRRKRSRDGESIFREKRKRHCAWKDEYESVWGGQMALPPLEGSTDTEPLFS